MHGCTGGGRGMTDAGRLTQPTYGFLETRRRRSALVAAGCVMLAALAFGQAPNDPLRYDDDLTEPAMPYVELDAPPLGPNRAGLRPGDLVYVDVYRRPELSTTTQVDASGNVTLPYVGVVHVAGKTDAEASLIAAQAFRRVLKSPQVTVSRTGAGMEGSFRTESMTTEIVVLENAKADQLAATLQGMNTEGGSVSFDSNTNSLIITDTPATLANILSVSERLDRMQSQLTQVRIEAKVAEVQTGAMKELGVRWFKQGAETNFGYYPLATQTPALNDLRAPQASPLTNEQVGGVSGNQGGSSAGGSGLGRRFVDEANFDRRLNIPAHIPRAGQLFFGLLNSHVDIGVMLDALVADNKAELLASPSILTVNHKTAEIRSTDEYPYTEFGTFVSGRNVFSTRFLDLGIKLTVTPHVGTDAYGRYVKIELEPEVSYPNGSANGIPIRSVRSSRTETNVRDGQTLVIGGIYQDSNNNVEEGVPGLRKVPLVGSLFKRTERVKKLNELMVFVTPHIHDTPETVTWDRMLSVAEGSSIAPHLPEAPNVLEARRD